MRISRRHVIGGAAALGMAPGALGRTAGDPVPFETNDNGHVIVAVTVNGRKLRALLDNGFSHTTLDRRVAESGDMRGGRRIVLNGTSVEMTTPFDFVMGAEARKVRAATMDLSGLHHAGAEVDMIVGADVLATMVVVFNFGDRWLMAAPGSWKVDSLPAGSTTLALTIAERGHQTIPIEVEGRRMQALLDFGAGVPLMLREGEQTHGWMELRRPWSTFLSGTMQGGALAFEESRITRAKSVRLGAHEVMDVPAELFTRDNKLFGDFEATVGVGLLARFLVALDLGRGQVSLTPAQRFREPFRFSTVGASAEAADGGLRVMHVSAHSPAEAAGLAAGDLIVAIDGRTPPALEQIGRARAGARLAVKLADGRALTVETAEFY